MKYGLQIIRLPKFLSKKMFMKIFQKVME